MAYYYDRNQVTQVTYSNLKLIGLEPVSYINYMGKKVTGARVSFAQKLSDDIGQGFKTFYQWIPGEKIQCQLAIGNYYDVIFNRQQNNSEYFDKLQPCNNPVEFSATI